jgi:hypothetical protein
LATVTPELQKHLKACATPAQSTVGIVKLSAAMKADPSLRAAANAELSRITDTVAKRCYISRRTREHLRKAMGDG